MKILHFYSENIKRIKAIEIEPESNTVVISGMNGHGKTSVLDSIWLALQYRSASKDNPSPLRSGTDKGMIELDLGDYIVTRTFSESGTTSLKISTSDGHQVSSPQKLLDGLIGDLSFDPWDFARKNEKEQREWLCDLLYRISGGKFNISEFDGKKASIAAKKLELSKERSRIENLMTSIRPPESSEPTEAVDVEALNDLLIDETDCYNKFHLNKKLIEDKKGQISRLLEQIESCTNQIKTFEKEISSLGSIPNEEELNVIMSQIKNSQKINERVQQIKNWNKYKLAISEMDNTIQKYKDDIELIGIEKDEALETCQLPVDGIKIEEDGIKIKNKENKWIPFCQMSSAQKLNISLSLAMKANPKMRVIRIADGSLLDDESMEIINKLADKEDYQVWIEYTSKNKNDRYGVYIENGEVV
jgi:DNA repair exonuclease SbcCD ATPase subunit